MSWWSERKHFITFCAIFALLAGLLGATLWQVLRAAHTPGSPSRTGLEVSPPPAATG